jgi:cytochrome P450
MKFITSLGSVDRGVVRVNVGTWPLYFVTGYEPAYQVLVSEARHFTKGRMFQQARPLIGDGLATSEGDLHRRQRRLMQPSFQGRKITGYAEVMSRRARVLADSWRHGQVLELDQVIHELSLSIVAEALFSVDVAGPVIEEVRRSLPVVIRGTPARAFLPKAVTALPLPMNRRFETAMLRLRRVIDSAIAQHSATPTAGLDLLSAMRTARAPDTGTGMSDQQICDEIITILLAGTETTATTLAWVFHEIARHPQVELGLQAEIDTVIGTRPVEFADVARLPYTSRVINEAVRLHSGMIMMRSATEAIEIGGHHLPAGAELVVSPYLIHRDPRLFVDPEVFDPERWLPDRLRDLPREAFLPFGLGRRKCIGDTFAEAEMVIAVAAICARWRLRPAPGHTVREVPAVIPQANRLPMIAEAR